MSQTRRQAGTPGPDGGTVRDVISPWAGVGPAPAPADMASTPPLETSMTFGSRVRLAIEQVMAAHVGAATALEWVKQAATDYGEPIMVSALAFGYAVINRLADQASREAAVGELNRMLLELTRTSVVPPPMRASTRPSRNPDLDRCRRGER